MDSDCRHRNIYHGDLDCWHRLLVVDFVAKWQVQPIVPDEFKQRFPELHPVVAQLLYQRGLITQEAIDEFLNPDYEQDLHDPFLFRDMQKAVDRIFTAVTVGEIIAVHGDYDADGVTSSVVMVSILEQLRSSFGPANMPAVEIFIPHREKEGYGLRPTTVKYFAEKKVTLVITVDCGIASVAEIAQAKEQGIDVIVTDHHQALQEIPAAVAVIDAHVAGETYPFIGLAGVGVAFKMAQALVREGKKRQPEFNWEGFEKWLLDAVAIGTVADVMPLLGENRTLVKYGLVVLNKTPRLGLRALLFKAGIGNGGGSNGTRDKLPKQGLNAYSIAFQIGPRLNAAGRMDHANTAYKLLITNEMTEAEALSDSIQQSNTARQTLTDSIMITARQQLTEQGQERLLVASGVDWPIGVLGLVANKLCEQFTKPVLVISQVDGQAAGSGRSVPHFDIAAPLAQLGQYLERYGGHRAACGFGLKQADQLSAFIAAFRAIADPLLVGEIAEPILEIDAALTLEDASWALYDELEKFEPFGEKNTRPKFLLAKMPLAAIEPLGKDGKHVRLIVKQTNGMLRKLIAFGQSGAAAGWRPGDMIDAVVDLGVNEWNGNRELQLKVLEARRADIVSSTGSEDNVPVIH